MNVRASDAERDATVERLREAAAEGRLTLEELGDRVEAAAGAVMRSELKPLTADLPGAGAAGHAGDAPAARTMGDIKRSGRWAVPVESSFTTWMGNITLDLRQAQISAFETHIHARVGMGNIKLLVPAGVEVDVRARTQIGRTSVDPAAAAPGGPLVVLTGGTVFGDIKVRRRRRLREKLLPRRRLTA
jgi:hypothetical protein